nr:hypothetical protein [Morchella crassipes]
MHPPPIGEANWGGGTLAMRGGRWWGGVAIQLPAAAPPLFARPSFSFSFFLKNLRKSLSRGRWGGGGGCISFLDPAAQPPPPFPLPTTANSWQWGGGRGGKVGGDSPPARSAGGGLHAPRAGRLLRWGYSSPPGGGGVCEQRTLLAARGGGVPKGCLKKIVIFFYLWGASQKNLGYFFFGRPGGSPFGGNQPISIISIFLLLPLAALFPPLRFTPPAPPPIKDGGGIRGAWCDGGHEGCISPPSTPPHEPPPPSFYLSTLFFFLSLSTPFLHPPSFFIFLRKKKKEGCM